MKSIYLMALLVSFKVFASQTISEMDMNTSISRVQTTTAIELTDFLEKYPNCAIELKRNNKQLPGEHLVFAEVSTYSLSSPGIDQAWFADGESGSFTQAQLFFKGVDFPSGSYLTCFDDRIN